MERSYKQSQWCPQLLTWLPWLLETCSPWLLTKPIFSWEEWEPPFALSALWLPPWRALAFSYRIWHLASQICGAPQTRCRALQNTGAEAFFQSLRASQIVEWALSFQLFLFSLSILWRSRDQARHYRTHQSLVLLYRYQPSIEWDPLGLNQCQKCPNQCFLLILLVPLFYQDPGLVRVRINSMGLYRLKPRAKEILGHMVGGAFDLRIEMKNLADDEIVTKVWLMG